MQRFNFQFTGQRFYRSPTVSWSARSATSPTRPTTTEFWNSMEAVGGPADLDARRRVQLREGWPGQVASVSHGCPTSLFRGVNILNTHDEAARGEPSN